MGGAHKPNKLNNDLVLKIITSPKFRIYRHFILMLFLGVGFANDKEHFIEPINTYINISHFVLLLLVVYINMYVFVPKLLFRDRYLGYLASLIVLFFFIQIITGASLQFSLSYLKPGVVYPRYGASVKFFFTFMFFLVIGASAAVKLFQQWVADSKRINELETITIYTELENLKKQINPHFLFNTLNNVNVLTQTDPEKASQIVIKLSDLLRYQLYDSARNKVLLSSEIHFLEDFLNLEKIRRDSFEFSIKKEGTINGIEVPPLLFITFIENAVKFNIDAEAIAFVAVAFYVSDGVLVFNCLNSKPKIKVQSNKHGGLGLANIKRTLDLLYPGKHTLTITDTNDRFNVELTIKL